MVDLIKKVQKKAGGDFEPDETILDARVIQPEGQAMRQALSAGAFVNFGAGAQALMDRHSKKRESEQRAAIEETGGLAAEFPTAKCFFTLTDRRVLVHSFAAMSGAPKELLVTYPLTDFAGIDAEQGKLISKMTLVMVDGSTVPLNVFKGGGDPAKLVDAFNEAIERVAAED